jgi:hypothetical protein
MAHLNETDRRHLRGRQQDAVYRLQDGALVMQRGCHLGRREPILFNECKTGGGNLFVVDNFLAVPASTCGVV